MNKYVLLFGANNKFIVFTLIPLIISIGIVPITSFAESDLPKWLEINEQWLTQGKITKHDYNAALQYLMNLENIKNTQSEFKIYENESDSKSHLNYFEKANTIPTEGDLADYYRVSFSGGPHEKQFTIYTFHEIDFHHDRKLPNGLEVPGSSFLVALKSLPGKDNQEAYDIIAELDNVNINSRRPVDMKIDTFSRDNSLINSIFLKKCKFVDYNISVQNSFDFNSNYQFPKAEDEIIGVCSGFSFNAGSDTLDELKIKTSAPFEVKRQPSDLVTSFDVHFMYRGPSKSSDSFTRFISNYYDTKITFALESMTSSDKPWYYKTMGLYSKNDALPGIIDVSIDIKSEDDSILQTWNYKKCKPVQTRVILEEKQDILERAVFECAGRDLTSGKSAVKRNPDSANDTLTEDEIAKTFRVHFYGGNLPKKVTYENLLKIDFFEYTPVNTKTKVPGFWIESLSSKKMLSVYKDLEYYFSSSGKITPVSVEVEFVLGNNIAVFSPLFTSCKIILVDPQMQIVNGERRLVDRVAFGCNNFVVNHVDDG